MAKSTWYCADCETHGGGPPCEITFQEHIDIAHDGAIARGVAKGDYRDYQRKENFRVENIDGGL